LTSRDRISQHTPSASWQAWIPIVIASALFAGAHFGHGTAPIPLFFLSLGLGYVYHRTHRIWPSLVTHALVNLLAVVQLKIAMDNGIPV
jgi:membrane protease YdiL (CAAX protease family)